MTQLNAVPKIELHCHLDGSLRAETVLEIYNRESQKPFGDLSIEEVRRMMTAPVPCLSLDMYLKSFDLPILIMQSKASLRRVTYELMEDAARENVKYIEIRFAPLNHVSRDRPLVEVLESVIEGMEEAEKVYEIKGNIIMSFMRHENPDKLKQMALEAHSLLGKGVVAVDLCGGENDRFAPRFKDAIAYCRALGYRVTIHAGETGRLENILDSVEILGAERIGHGVALIKSENKFEWIVEKGVVFECCPTSNLQTKAVDAISKHPMKVFYEKGVDVTVNTDNRTVSNTSMQEELDMISKAFQWHEKEAKTLFENGIKSCFASNEVKNWLRQFL